MKLVSVAITWWETAVTWLWTATILLTKVIDSGK